MQQVKFLVNPLCASETNTKQASRCLALTICLGILFVGAPGRAKTQSDEFQPVVQSHQPNSALAVIQDGIKPYASSGVWEGGGSLSWAHAADVDALSFNPAVGYFIADNFELSLITQLHYDRLRAYPENSPPKERKNTQFNILVEPSTHLPITNNVYVFAGFGVGLAFSNQAPNFVIGVEELTDNNKAQASGNVAFAMAPRVGLNFAVGQSGILSPSVALNWSDDGNMQIINNRRLSGVQTSWATNIGYSMIW